MTNRFLRSIQLDGFLSFPPKSDPIELTSLNVLIGPNGSGKSNLIEAMEFLQATNGDLAAVVREGGGAGEWLWKGKPGAKAAKLLTAISASGALPQLRYRLEFTETKSRMEIVDEALEETKPRKAGKDDVIFYYRFQHGHPAINTRVESKDSASGYKYVERKLKRESLDPQQSVFSQRRDPDLYPEVTQIGAAFGRIQTFREWIFGRSAPTRTAQPADLPADRLLPRLENLGLVLNDIQHSDVWPRLNQCLHRFLPRFEQLTTRIHANSVQIYLHEEGLRSPLPATRLSDGTIRMIALLAVLLRPDQATLICIDEPELGLHPDALDLMAELLVQASSRTQLIVTTHSDALVSALTDHAESVLVCDYLGGTTMRRLESQRLQYWLDKYRLGEVWRIGELGGNP